MPTHLTRAALALLAALALVAGSACGSGGAGTPTGEAGARRPVTLRLGYFPNLTHATAAAGIEQGIYAERLRPDDLKLQTFSAGPTAVAALFANGLDAAYLGPNPAINAFSKSGGTAIRIISGATSGGASLVVRPTINQPSDLRDKKIGSPQLGGTQDVALRVWLDGQGLKPDRRGGAYVLPQSNAQTLETFRTGGIDGAWVPEPWATRLVEEAGGKVLVHERSLWPDGQFVTTHLVVRTRFLEKHPATVKRLLEAHVAANELVNASPAEAQRLANNGIERITGKGLSERVLSEAWKNLTFTNDPLPSSLARSARDAQQLGLIDKADLTGIYELSMLDEVLRETGRPPVPSSWSS